MQLAPFGCVTKLSAKRANLMKKFVPRSRVGIFRNERNRSTPLDSKLMFLCVLYYLDAFGSICLPYKTRCKTGRSGAKVRAMKTCQNFLQRTYPSTLLNPKLMFDIVSYYFCAFGTVRLRYKTQCKTGQIDAKVRATKSRWNFCDERNRSTPLDSKLVFWCVLYYLDAFGPFGCLTKLNAKWAKLMQKFVP